MSAIATLMRLRQEDSREFETPLCNVVRVLGQRGLLSNNSKAYRCSVSVDMSILPTLILGRVELAITKR